MKIGFDGKRAVQNFTGLGNYSRYVADILCRYYPNNDYILYTPRKQENKRLDVLIKQHNQLHLCFPTITFWKRFNALWRIWGVTQQLQKEKIDIFHGLSNELPLNIHKSPIKSIVTVHDLIFLRFPKYYNFIDREIYKYKFKKACENSEQIIAISECTKRDIIQYFNIPPNKIEVVYQGCDTSFTLPVNEEKKRDIREKYRLPEHYILNVGSIEERKNILLAVQAITMLPKHIHIVIIGKRTKYTKKIEEFASEHGIDDRVHILSDVPFNDLPAFYQSAEIFVYPSRFEGFGIPIIEALNSGVPVVAATGSCLEEAGGPDSIYVDPDDSKELANAFKHIYSNSEKRKEMIEKGVVYAKRFSERKQAEKIINIYKQLLK